LRAIDDESGKPIVEAPPREEEDDALEKMFAEHRGRTFEVAWVAHCH
jgi:hypothetical protein